MVVQLLHLQHQQVKHKKTVVETLAKADLGTLWQTPTENVAPSFDSKIRLSTNMFWANIGTLSNLRTKTNLQTDLATGIQITLLDGNYAQSKTVLLANLDVITGKSASFNRW